ncbi:MAG: hypothetical protein LBL46_04375 [Rickettsiales bacterium]|jgi:hypothetical protein|nr:hypothetical protein [Rickettsiales bacterium]
MSLRFRQKLARFICWFIPMRRWRNRFRRFVYMPRVSFAHERLPLKKSSPINIAFCFDKNLVRQAAVVMTSLFEVSKDRCDYNIYCVVEDNVSEEDKQLLRGFAPSGSSLIFLNHNSDFDHAKPGKLPRST